VRRAWLVVCAGALVLTVAAPGAAGGPVRPDASREFDLAFRSAALRGELHYEVYLPGGYASSGKRYPVVYFLHGLPASSVGYKAAGFVEQALDKTGRQAILVAPQGARDNEPDPEYVDHGPGDRWETAIATELPRIVDARYRTIRSRSGRAIIGLSAGGFGAMHNAIAHLGEFAAVESWSGYFHPTDPTGTKALSLGAANDVHEQIRATVAELHRLPLFLAFYVGRGDARFEAENVQLNRELAQDRIPHVFRLYTGGHDQRLWQTHARAWLVMALAHLAPAR